EAKDLAAVRESLAQLKGQIRIDTLALLTPEQQSLLPKEATPPRPAFRGPLGGFLKQQLRGVTLSPEQETKLDELVAGFAPIYQAEVTDALAAVWTPERKAAHAAALQAAAAAGKDRRELTALETKPSVLNAE